LVMMTADRIVRLGASIDSEIVAAESAGRTAVAAFVARYGRVGDGEVPVDEVEALEEQIDSARRRVMDLERSLSALRVCVRRELVEAGADGWVCQHGAVYFEGHAREETADNVSHLR
jgi:hypothetical protein